MDSTSFQGIFALLFYTNFVQLFTVLTLLRLGLGFFGGGMGLIMGGLALAFAVVGADNSKTGFSLQDVFRPGINWEQSFKENVSSLAKPEITQKILELREKRTGQPSGGTQQGLTGAISEKDSQLSNRQASFSVLVASSIFSQIIEAFKTGAKLLIPFLVIDILLGTIISGVGVSNFSLESFSAPLKIIFFVTVGGWELILKLLA